MTDELLRQIVTRTLGFEGSCAWMYLDTATPPRVTCGAGHALFSAADSLLLPWRAGAQPAQATAVRSDYLAVQTAPAGHTAGFYEPLTVCRLTDADIRAMLQADIIGRLAVVRKHFLPQFDALPDGVQGALVDMIVNCGPYFLSRWPKLFAAIKAGDWSEAAVQSHREPPVSAERNAATAKLFREGV